MGSESIGPSNLTPLIFFDLKINHSDPIDLVERALAIAVVALIALAGMAGFAVPFYIGIEVLKWQGAWVDPVLGLIGAVPVLAAVWAANRFYVRRFPAGVDESHDRRAAREAWQAEAARREADRKAAIERHATDPRWERWWPLIRVRWIADETILARLEARFHELKADPKRHPWAERLVADGIAWTDRQIDYEEDPSTLVTCPHLQPVERALREHGVACSAQAKGPHIDTDAYFHMPRLRERFPLPDSVRYEREDSHPHASPEERLRCTACQSVIESRLRVSFPPP